MDNLNILKMHIEANELSKLCRTCLKDDGVIDMYQKKFRGYLYSELLSLFNLLNANKSEGYPEKICKSCADSIAQIYCFYKTLSDTQDALRIIFGTVINSIQMDHSYYSLKTPSEENIFIDNSDKEPTNTTELVNEIDTISVDVNPADLMDHNLEEKTQRVDLETEDSIKETMTNREIENPSLREILKTKRGKKISSKGEHRDCDKTDKRKYQCKFCKEVFTCKKTFVLHKRQELNKKSRCPFCKQIMHPTKIEEHLRIAHRRGPPITCHICGKRFISQLRFKVHLMAHEKAFVCDICGLHCLRHYNFLRHIKTHNKPKTNPRKFVCDKCGKGFKYRYVLTDHMATHSNDRPFLCSICGLSFLNMRYLYRHNVKEHENNFFICNKCGIKFVTEKGLERHQQLFCKTKNKRISSVPLEWKCKTCGETVDRKASISHVKTHSDKFPFLCYQCGDGFNFETEYDDHKKCSHSICNICNKNFKNSTQLKIHYRVHTGERPYECSECKKTFKNFGNLDTHKKSVHSKEKSFKCQYCNKAFALRGNLKQHILTHGSFKRHTCFCGKGYNTNSSLKKHMQQHI